MAVHLGSSFVLVPSVCPWPAQPETGSSLSVSSVCSDLSSLPKASSRSLTIGALWAARCLTWGVLF